MKNIFWKDVLKAYMYYIKKLPIVSSRQILNMPLFYNTNFKINTKTIYITGLYNRGIRLVKDILDDNGNCITLNKLEAVVNTKINFLHYFSLHNAVKSYMKSKNFQFNECLDIYNINPCINSYMSDIITRTEINKWVYNILVKNTDVPTSQTKWNSLSENINVDWKYSYEYSAQTLYYLK